MAHGYARFGFYFGGPGWGYPGPYYYPYYAPAPYYYPPPVVYQQAPQYVERPATAAAPPADSAPQASDNDWYFCRDTQTYYPYVKQCASPWERVPSRPGS
jgi:hypothetical protein